MICFSPSLAGIPAQGTRVQFKGGMVHWSPTHIYITSPLHPAEWYPNLAANDKIGQLLRRFTAIHKCVPVGIVA